MKRWMYVVMSCCLITLPLNAIAGNLDSPDVPGAGSGMYTLQEVYDYVVNGTVPSAPGAFQEPSAGPSPTMKTLKEVYDGFKALIDQITVAPEHVLSGQTFFSTSGTWGPAAGTMPNVGQENFTPGTTAQAITQGYHNGTGEVAGDANLTAPNIADGVEIFGVAGSALVATGDATAANVLTGTTFSNSSAVGVSGTMPNVGQENFTPGTTAQTISEGYHNGTGEVAGDADLTAPNIADGVEIFSVTGTATLASGDATDADVLDGVSYSNADGASTGTMPNNGSFGLSCGDADQSVTAGYYSGGTLAGDAELLAENIKDGVDLFGVTGTYPLAAVPKTGQITSYGTGDDGGLKKGVVWPNPRFTDNSDGTETDNLTGLVWMKTADCWGEVNWETALSNANTLASGSCGLSDGSAAGDWRLPNLFELESLRDMSQSNPALPTAYPFTDVQLGYYWTSTTYAPDTTIAWLVLMDSGKVDFSAKTNTYYAWAVRGGQACPAGTLRDNGDGTVTDLCTNKMWLKDMACLGTGTWGNAGTAGTVQNAVADLNAGTELSCNGYTAGTYADWHLPSNDEWQALTGATDESSTDWTLPVGHPFFSQQAYYWTSTPGEPSTAWYVHLGNQTIGLDNRANTNSVWAVR